MTTIVYRDGFLAADRYLSNSGTEAIIGTTCKVWAVPDYLLAFAGDFAEGRMILDWVRDGMDEATMPPVKESTVILVDRAGNCFDMYAPFLVKAPFNAPYNVAGSGGAFALGALAMGATAVEAVTVACTFDPFSGGGVDALHIRDILPAKKTKTRARSKRAGRRGNLGVAATGKRRIRA